MCFLAAADNLWWVAPSLHQASAMVYETRAALCPLGWELPVDKMTWLSNGLDSDGSTLIIDGSVVTRCPRVQGMRVLGSQVAGDARTTAETRRRVNLTLGHVWQQPRIWSHRCVSERMRARFLECTSRGTLLWVAETWTPSRTDQQLLRAAQRRLYLSIVRCPRGKDESEAEYCRRRASRVSALIQQTGERWGETVFHRIHEYAGRIARRPAGDLAQQVLLWRGSQWLHSRELRMGGRQHHHRGRLRVWRWEQQF